MVRGISEIESMRKLKIHNDNNILGSISHYFKTPLNGIIGVLDSFEKEIINTENMKKICDARNLAEILFHKVNDLLDILSIQKNNLQINLEDCLLSDEIEKVYSLMKFQVENKGLLFRLQNECPPDTVVHIDKNRFTQVLLNLIGNAVKFTNRGYVSLNLSIIEEEFYYESISMRSIKMPGIYTTLENLNFREENKQRRILIEIVDSGIGIKT